MSLYNLYATNDRRRPCFYTVQADGVTFKGNYAIRNTPFNGLATDEIFLIRAECAARADNVTAAMKDLNDLLRTRWTKVSGVTTYVDQVAADGQDALNRILTERRKELVIRGVRWTDMRRLNRDDRFKTTITRIVQGTTYTLEPGSYKYVFPIPDDVIAATGMQQNAGW
jgi:hypothetical protein